MNSPIINDFSRRLLYEKAFFGVIRIVVRGGEVTSKHDGDTHSLNHLEVANLYGVMRWPVYFYINDGRGYKREPRDLLLGPRADGNYNLEDAYLRAIANGLKERVT